VDAKNAFDGYIHSMRSATEGSGDNKGLSEKMDSDEKEPWIKTYCIIFFVSLLGGMSIYSAAIFIRQGRCWTPFDPYLGCLISSFWHGNMQM
jgi:hypothetical protein